MVLELPTSLKFFVKKIDYKSQVIEIHDPYHCFPRQLHQLNLSSSPFLIKKEFFMMDYALFNCSSTETQADYAISCLSGPSHEVRAFFKDDDITDLPIASCKKMYTLPSIPISTKTLIFRGQHSVSKEIGDDKTLQLNWSRPVCSECEEKGMRCRLRNNSNESETECFPKHAKGLLSKLKIPGIILGSFLLVRSSSLCSLPPL
ncbi:putative RING-H2 finger protein ATL21A [Corylus avellana]|uniref:putative RING-H2 finger protein ATL21A n=1 Tax=Corylus avellana TaxID=13451 RepID=UPI00286B6DB3|nr:putative RING-H2 finger protein ATL21A [Corylus avellana]